MKILIAGGTGLIGSHVAPTLLMKKHEVIVVGRSINKINSVFGRSIEAVTWENLPKININSIHAIINLTGENIANQRWSESVKKTILNSRIVSTKLLIDWASKTTKEIYFYNAGAISIYGLEKNLGHTTKHTESTKSTSQQQSSFLEEIAHKWEQATQSNNSLIKVTSLRLAPVLKINAGMLKKIAPIFKMGLGGPLGNGLQPFSWIHIDDVVKGILFLLEHPSINGPVNLCSPITVTQKQFAKSFGKFLHRPAIIPTPACFLKLAYGQLADELLLQGTYAYPEKLLASKFQFTYPTLKSIFTKDHKHE
jgi:uncharacterized protein (TIGR01777 family)